MSGVDMSTICFIWSIRQTRVPGFLTGLEDSFCIVH